MTAGVVNDWFLAAVTTTNMTNGALCLTRPQNLYLFILSDNIFSMTSPRFMTQVAHRLTCYLTFYTSYMCLWILFETVLILHIVLTIIEPVLSLIFRLFKLFYCILSSDQNRSASQLECQFSVLSTS